MYTRNWHKAQTHPFIKKSLIFTQFFWYLVKMTTIVVSQIDLVSEKMGKNCGFFDKSIFLGFVSISSVHTVSIKVRGHSWTMWTEKKGRGFIKCSCCNILNIPYLCSKIYTKGPFPKYCRFQVTGSRYFQGRG